MKYMIKKVLKISIIVSILLILSIQNSFALKIIPPRLVIKSDEKVQYMFVKNNSNQVEAYRFAWKHLAMDKQGNVVNLDKEGMDKVPDYKSASQIIRFSPRRTILKPGETQRVAFVTRRSPDYEDGEYRSHFLIEREKKESVELTEEERLEEISADMAQPPVPIKNSAVAIDVLISRSVPIYVLNGKTEASLKVVDASIGENTNKTKKEQPNQAVNFRLEKLGNRSVIGVADVFCMQGAKRIQLNKVSKIFAVYSEADFKQEKLLFDLPDAGCSSMSLQIKAHNNDVLAGKILVNKPIGN